MLAGFRDEDLAIRRACCRCGTAYVIAQELAGHHHYFHGATDYERGCTTSCLACWLGVGPEDDEETASGQVGSNLEYFFGQLPAGTLLAVLPMGRVHLDEPMKYPGAVFFPAYEDWEIGTELLPGKGPKSLARHQFEGSGVSLEKLTIHPTVAFPVRLDWEVAVGMDHRGHMDLIRLLSEALDETCLNVLCYHGCDIDSVESLPAKAGQTLDNVMMAGALLLNSVSMERLIIGGAAFTHVITEGLGLPLDPLPDSNFPQEGEVGHIARHALSLYRSLLSAESATPKFMQAMTLIEFLANPYEYQQFKDVKKVIARYVASDAGEYQRILDRFYELTGKKDPDSNLVIGYRTRIVHIGDRLEKLLPSPLDRRALFRELDSYIRPVLNHMIEHSGFTFAEYLEIRTQIRPDFD